MAGTTKLETLHEEWSKDQQLDFSNPVVELQRVPLLHHKWWTFFTQEREHYHAAKRTHDKLRQARLDWYTGRMSDDERIGYGWPPQPLRLVRSEIDDYLNADVVLAPYLAAVERQTTKLKFIEDVIKHINSRGYMIKTYVDYLRFSQGS